MKKNNLIKVRILILLTSLIFSTYTLNMLNYDNFPTKVVEAICSDNIGYVVDFLNSDINNINLKDYFKKTILTLACSNSSIKILTELIKRKVDLNFSDENNEHPLKNAILNGNLQVFNLLIMNGAEIKDFKEMEAIAKKSYLTFQENLKFNWVNSNITTQWRNKVKDSLEIIQFLENYKNSFMTQLRSNTLAPNEILNIIGSYYGNIINEKSKISKKRKRKNSEI